MMIQDIDGAKKKGAQMRALQARECTPLEEVLGSLSTENLSLGKIHYKKESFLTLLGTIAMSQ